jgi:hypothetical protein
MRQGGYFDRVMAAGAELDRVKEYLLILEGKHDPPAGAAFQDPCIWPIFPGLGAQAFRDAASWPGTAALEAQVDAIRQEALSLDPRTFVPYLTKSTTEAGEWSIYPFVYMGVVAPYLDRHLTTWQVVSGLPRVCLRYPWGDALFSAHLPGAYLPPHCSVDNFRVRCHLPLVVPGECAIRVGERVHHWREGECVVFDDSFEHEAWNRSNARRLILIVDFWHPELTDPEIRALEAGFRKAEVRSFFYEHRLRGKAQAFRDYIWQEIRASEREDVIREFWNTGSGRSAARP